MNGPLHRSVRIYQKLLLLYPEDLRRDFGNEMVLAFAEDLEQAWGDARVAGVIQIWSYAIRELVTVTLPSQRSNPSVIVPALAFILAVFVQGAELCVALRHMTRVDSSVLSEAIQLAVLLPSFLNALVAAVVTRLYASCSIIALRLQ